MEIIALQGQLMSYDPLIKRRFLSIELKKHIDSQETLLDQQIIRHQLRFSCPSGLEGSDFHDDSERLKIPSLQLSVIDELPMVLGMMIQELQMVNR